MADVAKQTKAPYCMERYPVNAEATWMESGYTSSGRSDDMQESVWANTQTATYSIGQKKADLSLLTKKEIYKTN